MASEMMLHFINILSIVTVGLCFVMKIPQILNLMSRQSANGISILGLILELTSYSVMTCYNIMNGYSLLSYLEYPILLIEEYVLIYFVLKYKNQIHIGSLLATIVYVILCGCLLLELISKEMLMFLAPLCTPISASSKIAQLFAILRSKNADSISPTTWMISAFTNLTRVYTIWMDSADLLLLGNFMISVLLSSAIMFSTLYYKVLAKKKD